MIAAEGILTAKGGVSSHAALVARQMGKVCVCGAAALQIDYAREDGDGRRQDSSRKARLSFHRRNSGKFTPANCRPPPSEIVQACCTATKPRRKREKYQNFNQLMNWCSKATRLQGPHQRRHPEQTENAIAFGAIGIGLCRTEHMFFEGDRIDAMREMILADNVNERRKRAREIAAVSDATISSASSRR